MTTSARAPVAITGIGAVSPWGWGSEALWRGLRSGGTAITAARGLDLSAQRTNVCGEVPGDETADGVASRCEGFALAAAREAVADAGLSDPLPRAGVFLGGSTAGMAEGEAWFQRARCGDHRSSRPLAAYLLSAPGDAVARAFGVRGRVLSLSSACASGALAIAAAVAAIRRGELEIALAGGADALCQLTYSGFNALRAVDAVASRPFLAERQGLSLGEGAAILVLEASDHARRRGARVRARLLGFGASCDAHHMTAPHPEGRGAEAALRAALDDAGQTAEDVGYYNAHGTGTPLNDAAEWKALAAVLGRRAEAIPTAAHKSSFGHLLGASGALEAVATVLALEHGVVPPTRAPGNRDPQVPVDLVRGAVRPLPEATTALSSSFAFGGANAVLALAAGGQEAR